MLCFAFRTLLSCQHQQHHPLVVAFVPHQIDVSPKGQCRRDYGICRLYSFCFENWGTRIALHTEHTSTMPKGLMIPSVMRIIAL